MKQLLLFFVLGLTATVSAQRTFTVNVENPMATERTDQPVVISLKTMGTVQSALVTLGGNEIPCQLDDLDQDERFDELREHYVSVLETAEYELGQLPRQKKKEQAQTLERVQEMIRRALHGKEDV